MPEFWTIPTDDMAYTRLQNCTHLVVDVHEIQTFEIVVFMLLLLLLMLLFEVFVPTSAHPF